jgi:predicted signal transduction protein with EAL and GGDEF domain
MAFNEESRVLTCSFGATTWMPGAAADEESLIRVADDALYRAKRQGRNRVVFLPSTTAPEAPHGNALAGQALPAGQSSPVK